MRFQTIFFISVYLSSEVYSQKIVYGSECDQPIRCVNSTTFAFCVIIDGKEQLIGNQTCLKGQECSISDTFQPCVNTSTPTQSTTLLPSTTVSAPNCEEQQSGKYPAPQCNQYYECSKMLWWWDLNLKTCSKKKAFSKKLEKCVPEDEAECNNK